MHVAFAVVAVPLVLALAGSHWFMAVASLLVFLLAVIPVAMMLHARNLRVRGREGMDITRSSSPRP